MCIWQALTMVTGGHCPIIIDTIRKYGTIIQHASCIVVAQHNNPSARRVGRRGHGTARPSPVRLVLPRIVGERRCGRAASTACCRVIMGSGSSSTLSQRELFDLTSMTHFTKGEIQHLFKQYTVLASTSVQDGKMDRIEFCSALGLETSMELSDKIFYAFDTNRDDFITFREFVAALSILSPSGSQEEKLRCALPRCTSLHRRGPCKWGGAPRVVGLCYTPHEHPP